MIHFQYIEYLIVLVAIPVMILFYVRVVKWKKKTAKKIGDPDLVKEITGQYSSRKFLSKFILFVLAFSLCAFAVAGLIEPDGTQKIDRHGKDIMIALDVSNSMLANDVKPNRLERAKHLISKIIENSPEDRFGLVLFAGRAYLQMPLTLDHKSARMYLSIASPDDVPTQGTVISEALKMSYAAFNPQDKTYKSILLISDGEDHDDEAIKITKDLAKQGIVINTIGIGSPLGAPIKDEETGQYKTDNQGNIVISKLNEEELKNIAQEGNGFYQLYSSTETIVEKFNDAMSRVESKASFSDSSFASFKQYFQYFLATAFLILLLEFFISEKRKPGGSIKKIKGATVFIFFMLIQGITIGQTSREIIIKGNQAFQENKLEDAEKLYRVALSKPGNNATASYNLGNVMYRKNKMGDAIKAYEDVIENTDDATLKQKAFYNKGVAFQSENKLPECIIAYKNALILDPKDEDARQNLQRALKQQQQNQQNKDKEKNKDKKKNKNQKNKEPKPKPSKISKQDAEEKLKSLLEKEKELQEKLHKIKGTAPSRPEKDW